MKTIVSIMVLCAALLTPQLCLAQAPVGAPAGSTGLCNDGTYYKLSMKTGACTGHKGVKTWWGAPPKAATPAKTAPAKAIPAPAAKTAPAPAAKTTPAPAAAPAAAPAPAAKTAAAPAPAAKSSASSTAAAPGGGPGLVWVNTASKVYHCRGSTYYGKTKAGAYMSEDQAKAQGSHANGGKPCTK